MMASMGGALPSGLGGGLGGGVKPEEVIDRLTERITDRLRNELKVELQVGERSLCTRVGQRTQGPVCGVVHATECKMRFRSSCTAGSRTGCGCTATPAVVAPAASCTSLPGMAVAVTPPSVSLNEGCCSASRGP